MASSLLLSFELIYLFGWLLKNEKPKLESLIKLAIKNGLKEELDDTKKSNVSPVLNEDLYDTFIDFVDYMENSLLDKLEKRANKTVQKKISTSLENINPKLKNIDQQVVWVALKQAENELSQKKGKTSKEAKKILLDKILKNWTPTKKDDIN
jgi:hypothetical protein